MSGHSLDACFRALMLPELLRLVCGFLDRKDCAAWLRTSRRAFASTTPIVWEDVDLKSVLLLIPEVQVTTEKPRPTLVIELPPTVDLTRFEIYRSFVKAVSTAAPYIIKFPKGWPAVGVQASPQALLPNLRNLIIHTFGSVDDPYVEWVPRFLTPVLKEFTMCSIPLNKSSGEDVYAIENAWINRETCIQLVDEISRTCRAIETLRIFSYEDRDINDEYAMISDKIASLQNLRSLSFGGACAGQALFQAFGRLPHLESLSLASDDTQALPRGHDAVTLSGGSFPALQHLALRDINPWIVQRVYDSPQLFRRLVSAVITYEDLDYDGCEGYELRSIYAMKCFSHDCSRLTDLTIITRRIGTRFSLFRPFLAIFKRMPLRRLRLCRVDLNPEIDDEDHIEETEMKENRPEITWEEFLATVPHLEDLQIGNRIVTQDLVAFAHLLPKLRLFAAHTIKVVKAEDASTRSSAAQPIVIRSRNYQLSDFGNKAKDISEMAR
ncbi:hypothetical protein FRC12_023154 [Ceratobasidium sp. 428]|nr:hypothetical protein FRC12_023154 [Ceratobasidium sp. 428]